MNIACTVHRPHTGLMANSIKLTGRKKKQKPTEKEREKKIGKNAQMPIEYIEYNTPNPTTNYQITNESEYFWITASDDMTFFTFYIIVQLLWHLYRIQSDPEYVIFVCVRVSTILCASTFSFASASVLCLCWMCDVRPSHISFCLCQHFRYILNCW